MVWWSVVRYSKVSWGLLESWCWSLKYFKTVVLKRIRDAKVHYESGGKVLNALTLRVYVCVCMVYAFICYTHTLIHAYTQ